jgi:hypothetical protein
LNYATKNSSDKGFRQYMEKQSEDAFQRMDAYWSKLLS